jgi:hypothetical protein
VYNASNNIALHFSANRRTFLTQPVFTDKNQGEFSARISERARQKAELQNLGFHVVVASNG